MRKTAVSKPGPSGGKSASSSSSGKNAAASGTRLWEKKPFSGGSKSSSTSGSKPSGDKSKDFKKPFQSNIKKRKADGDAELTPEAKKARKVLTAQQVKERKMLKPNAPLVAEVLRLWGLFSQKTTPKEEKHKLITELLKVAKGKIADIVFRGSASRVFQSVLKEGHGEHRALVFAELKEHVLEMAKNSYAHRLLMRLLQYGTVEQTDVLIKEFYGHVCLLMRQRDASKVLEYIYSNEEIGRPLQKLALVEEFYGVEFEAIKPKHKRTLDDILAQHPEKKASILAHLRGKLMPIINKADMSILLNHTILHLPLLKLFELSSVSENDAMIEALKDNLVRLVHSKEGAKVACMCLGYGSPKARKSIIKAMKGYVVKIAMEQHGHVVLLRLFDVLDDTVLVSKSILSELKPHLLELAEDRFGRLVLLYLLSPKNKRYFTSEALELLQPVFVPEKVEEPADDEDDGSAPTKKPLPKPTASSSIPKMVPTSKKEEHIRQTELYNAIIPEIRNMVVSQSFRLLSHIYARDVIFETIVTSTAVVDEEEKHRLLNSVLRLVGDPAEKKRANSDEDDEDEVTKAFHALDYLREKPMPEEDIMTHSLVHRMLRRFIDEEPGFDVLLLEAIGDKVWDYTEKTYGSWVIYSLLQSPATKDKVTKVLKAHKAQLSALAKIEANKAAQAIELYLRDPNASKAAQQPHEKANVPSATSPKGKKANGSAATTPNTKATGDDGAKKKEKAKEKEKERAKVKSVPLVHDDEEEEEVEKPSKKTPVKKSEDGEAMMDVDEKLENEESESKRPRRAAAARPKSTPSKTPTKARK